MMWIQRVLILSKGAFVLQKNLVKAYYMFQLISFRLRGHFPETIHISIIICINMHQTKYRCLPVRPTCMKTQEIINCHSICHGPCPFFHFFYFIFILFRKVDSCNAQDTFSEESNQNIFIIAYDIIIINKTSRMYHSGHPNSYLY